MGVSAFIPFSEVADALGITDAAVAAGSKALDAIAPGLSDAIATGLSGASKLLGALTSKLGQLTTKVLGEEAEMSGGSLTVTASNPSASELRAAQELAAQGKTVELRDPTGTRAGGMTSDIVADGVNWDVYTPTGSTVKNILTNVAKKFSQVQGGGVIVDLSETGLSASDFGENYLARVNGMINSWGKSGSIGEIQFFGGTDG